METNLDVLAQELTALSHRFADLGAKLGDAARALEEAGAPPGRSLVSDLAGARDQFIQLRTDVLTAAQAASVLPRTEPESLTELEPLLETIQKAIRSRVRAQAFEKKRQAVVATLDRVLSVVHRDDPAFATLVDCHDKARALRDSAVALTDPEAPEAQRLATSAQPFADLLALVEDREALNDDRYAQLEESVSRGFGRALAVAIARGRLAFASDVAGEVAAEAPEPAPVLLEEPMAAPAPEPTPVLDALPVLAAPTVEEPPVELAIEAPPAPPAPAVLAVETPVTMPTIEMPSLTLDTREPVAPPTPSAPADSPAPSVRAAAPAPAGGPAARSTAVEPSAPDETAQWWLAAWARWSGWKATHDFADVVREELGKYPYLLSVPIQRSPDYEEGLLAYGYSILLDHVEKQNRGCVGNALNSLKAGVARPVGDQLYDYLITEGRLAESYQEFIKNVLLAAVPEPGLWFQFRILESKEDTRIFQRASARLGDSELSGQRLASDSQRYAEHKFKMTLPPLTMRCVQVSADSIRDARSVGVKIASEGRPCDTGWIGTVPAGSKGKTDARRVAEDGTHVPGLGRDFSAVWVALFNPDTAADRRYDLSVFLRKDTKSPFRGRG